MNNLDLNAYGVQEMQKCEMMETDGGFIPLLIIGGVLLLTSCTIVVNKGDNNEYNIGTKVSTDSTLNGNDVNVGVKGGGK